MKNLIPKICFILGLIAVLLLLTAALGTRFGLYSYHKAFILLRISVYVGLITVVISLISLIFIRYHIVITVFGLILGLLAAGITLNNYRIAKTVPHINDITTDTSNPPLYDKIVSLRINAENKIEYGGPAVAKKQNAGYPDIKTLFFKMKEIDAFNKALKIAKASGWEIISANNNVNVGRIEAIATSFWFGFKDDILIRVTEDENGTKIDMRSKSRVGGGDFGVNAKRIRKFMKEFSS